MIQLALPSLAPLVGAQPGAYRVCTSCGGELLLDGDRWARDKRAPAGFALRCKACRYRADRRWGSQDLTPPRAKPREPVDPIHAEALRRLEAQTQAAREGAPQPTFGPIRPMLTLAAPPPRVFCPDCDDHYAGKACPCCGARVVEARIDDDFPGLVHLELEHHLHRGRARYRGRVEWETAIVGDAAVDRIATVPVVERQVGDAWITVNRTETREEFVRLCERVRIAAQKGRL
jgi:hypothetical protein